MFSPFNDPLLDSAHRAQKRIGALADEDVVCVVAYCHMFWRKRQCASTDHNSKKSSEKSSSARSPQQS